MRLALVALLIACSSSPPTATPPTASGSEVAPPAPPSPPVGTGSAAPAKPYTGAPERGPCSDVHQCELRDVCGCSCEGVLASAPRVTACDESCPDTGVCKRFSAICDRATQTCGAIPRAP